MSDFLTFQEIITRLNHFWQEQDCVLIQPLDMEVGAGTFHPATFLRSIGPEPWRSAYVQPSRRPTDGRYGDNPNRLQHYYQYQVLLKPAPNNLQQLYLQSLQTVGIDLTNNDVRFVEDNWESPTLGAWGLGWEVWLNGMEVTQFTYFQQAGGLECKPISGELTYGLERLAMYLQGVDSVYDLVWTRQGERTISYHQIYHQNEVEQSQYNFEFAHVENLFNQFEQCYEMCTKLVNQDLPLPAYEQVMKASHLFNLLDARKAISVTERQRYIFRVRELASLVAHCYSDKRERLGYPLGLIKPLSSLLNEENTTQPLNTQEKEDFLFELGCEELPTDSVLPLARGLKQGFVDGLKEQRFPYEDIIVYATPRRLAVQIKALQTLQNSGTQKRKGPRTDAPEKAHMGFARSCGVELTQLNVENISGVEYLVHNENISAKHFSQQLPEIIKHIIAKLPLKKTMRWEDNDYQFPRPVRWILALLGNQVAQFSLFGLATDNKTYGHRVNHQNHGSSGIQIEITEPCQYQEKLRTHSVIVDFSERKKNILQQLEAQAHSLSAQINMDEQLLNQVTSLTEFPTVVLGAFPKQFLRLPEECLITTLQTHQKYFTLRDDKGKLLPFFMTVSNLPNQDFEWVKKGNEKVVIPRLEDAEFFWQQDKKQPLHHYAKQLDSVVFVEGLGNISEKHQRVGQLALYMANALGEDALKIKRACALIKCDLVTHMVGEFPELQGIMGRYYALDSEEDNEVAEIIEEHYFPKQANGALPSSVLSSIVAIADKLDTITGIHIVQKQPTGSSDPFSLRRAALGVMQILEHQKINLNLQELIKQCTNLWQSQLQRTLPNDIITQIEKFMWGRLYSLYTKDKQIPAPYYQAVITVQPPHPFDFSRRLMAIQNFVKLPQANILSETNTRIKNILQKNPLKHDTEIDTALLELEPEKLLFSSLKEAQKQLEATEDYLQKLTVLSELASPVEQFFDGVMVLDEDQAKRINRLTLLAQLRQCFLQIADISLLQLSK